MEMRSGDSMKTLDESSELSLFDNKPVTVVDGLFRSISTL